MDCRGLLERYPHPHDGHAVDLHLTCCRPHALAREAEQALVPLARDASAKLLQKRYL